jgi:nucleoside-diphosphate-sugar epimerase
VVDRLKAAEASLCDAARRSGTDLFLLRPTLIYGSGRDRNVSSIARFIARFGFFPLAGDGRGLRQPVHAADLAKGVIVLLESELQGVRSYNLSGGETLTYRQMVERVFLAQGRRPRLLRLPEAPLRMGLRLLQMFPGFRHLSASMVDRMNRDLVYDHSEAARDFGYRPRPFYPEHLGRDGADPD